MNEITCALDRVLIPPPFYLALAFFFAQFRLPHLLSLSLYLSISDNISQWFSLFARIGSARARTCTRFARACVCAHATHASFLPQSAIIIRMARGSCLTMSSGKLFSSIIDL